MKPFAQAPMSTALLLGTILGVLLVPSLGAQQVMTLTVGSGNAAPGTETEISIMIRGGQALGPLDLELTYDAQVLEVLDVVEGDVMPSGLLEHAAQPGLLRVGLVSNGTVSGDGELLRLKVAIRGKRGQSSRLEITKVQAWDWENLRELLVDVEAGELSVGGSLLPLLIAVGVLFLLLVILAVRRQMQMRRPVAYTAAPQPDASRQAGGRFCSGCGQPVQGAFCSHCGHPAG